MRYLAVLLAVLALHGCFFFWVPIKGDSGETDARFNTCVDEKAYIGYRLRHADGRLGTVRQIFGRSSRCQVASNPILAAVEYE